MLWAREPVSRENAETETEAEVVRVMWRAVHPAPVTVRSCIGCEELADAVGTLDRGVDTPLLDDEATDMADAIEIFGDSHDIVDMASVLYGDDVATHMGWTPLGLADHAGYRWAASRGAVSAMDPVGQRKARPVR